MMSYFNEEAEAMRRVLMGWWGIELNSVYINDSVYVGVAYYQKGDEVVEITILRESDDTRPVTFFRNYKDTSIMINVTEFENRKYLIIERRRKIG